MSVGLIASFQFFCLDRYKILVFSLIYFLLGCQVVSRVLLRFFHCKFVLINHLLELPNAKFHLLLIFDFVCLFNVLSLGQVQFYFIASLSKRLK